MQGRKKRVEKESEKQTRKNKSKDEEELFIVREIASLKEI
jgi:hypothetical protein